WDFTVQAIRTSNFPPAEFWTVRGIPITNGGRMMIAATNNFGGFPVSLDYLGRNSKGSGSQVNGLGAGDDTMTVMVTATAYPGDYQMVLVQSTDNQGRTKIYNSGPSAVSIARAGGPFATGNLQFHLVPPDLTGSTSIDLTFAVTKARY